MCQHDFSKKFGKDRHGRQRYRCLECGKTWLEERPQPIGNMRIPTDRAVMVLRQLLEGSSVRVTERLTGVNRNTICNLLGLIGERCRMFWLERMKGIRANDVQVDEIWGFVAMKEKTRERLNECDQFGDAWTFVGIERNTKLVICYHVGKRTPEDARWFLDKMRESTEGRFQLSTDGWTPYCTEVVEAPRPSPNRVRAAYQDLQDGKRRAG